MKKPTQRTGNFGARARFRPGEPEIQLQALLHKMGARIQEATNDGRTYTVEIKITAYLTVEPGQAEIGEYIHSHHFQFDQGENPALATTNPSTEKRVFQRTKWGYQRTE